MKLKKINYHNLYLTPSTSHYRWIRYLSDNSYNTNFLNISEPSDKMLIIFITIMRIDDAINRITK